MYNGSNIEISLLKQYQMNTAVLSASHKSNEKGQYFNMQKRLNARGVIYIFVQIGRYAQ